MSIQDSTTNGLPGFGFHNSLGFSSYLLHNRGVCFKLATRRSNMKKTIIWIAAIVLGILLLAALILPWLVGGMGYGMRPYGGMMGRDFGTMHPMGWAGLGLGWLFLLACLVF